MTAAAATPTQLSVSWTAPTNAGPAITDYDVRYRADVTAPNGDFTDAHYNGTTTSTTLTDLKPSTSYQVQVRADNGEGIGPWSDAGTAKTAAQPEDVDNDGDVDINDLLAVISNFGSTSPGRNDVDKDNDVDADDIRQVFNELLTAERAAAGAPAQAARRITHTAEALHHYVQQTKQNGMLDGNLHRGLRVLEELIEPFLMPDETALLRNYPNPFNPETWIPYQLSQIIGCHLLDLFGEWDIGADVVIRLSSGGCISESESCGLLGWPQCPRRICSEWHLFLHSHRRRFHCNRQDVNSEVMPPSSVVRDRLIPNRSSAVGTSANSRTGQDQVILTYRRDSPSCL